MFFPGSTLLPAESLVAIKLALDWEVREGRILYPSPGKLGTEEGL